MYCLEADVTANSPVRGVGLGVGLVCGVCGSGGGGGVGGVAWWDVGWREMEKNESKCARKSCVNIFTTSCFGFVMRCGGVNLVLLTFAFRGALPIRWTAFS